jgi:hypothetical protein
VVGSGFCLELEAAGVEDLEAAQEQSMCWELKQAYPHFSSFMSWFQKPESFFG